MGTIPLSRQCVFARPVSSAVYLMSAFCCLVLNDMRGVTMLLHSRCCLNQWAKLYEQHHQNFTFYELPPAVHSFVVYPMCTYRLYRALPTLPWRNAFLYSIFKVLLPISSVTPKFKSMIHFFTQLSHIFPNIAITGMFWGRVNLQNQKVILADQVLLF